jgi:hypothetical protein
MLSKYREFREPTRELKTMNTAPRILMILASAIFLGHHAKVQATENTIDVAVPQPLLPFVAEIRISSLGDIKPRITIEPVSENVYHFRLALTLPEEVRQDDWRLDIHPAFDPDFHWSPHLTPTDEHIIDQHSFRSPALITTSLDKLLILVPDLDLLREETAVRRWEDFETYWSCSSYGKATLIGKKVARNDMHKQNN